MPEVQIRPAVSTDLIALMAMDHSCQSDYVWQMDVQHEAGQFGAIFREIRLPHTVMVPYPRNVSALSENWNRKSGILVAVINGAPEGYIRINDAFIPHTAWLMDVVIDSRYRRQGIASALVLAAQSWAIQRNDSQVLLEMSSKNNPAIHLAQKLGYEFCGYNDQYYLSQDIALFFGRLIR